jgi:hypothetical protein
LYHLGLHLLQHVQVVCARRILQLLLQVLHVR